MDSDQASSLPESSRGEVGCDDALSEVDKILEERKERLAEAADRIEAEQSQRRQFLGDFASLCERVIRPAMLAVVQRLRSDGGGGFIERHAGGEARFLEPGLTLWMSLEGEMGKPGREDRYPYLRLDADPAHGRVIVSRGDMWQGGGTHTSGRAGTWQLSEITADLVEHTSVDILRRSAT